MKVIIRETYKFKYILSTVKKKDTLEKPQDGWDLETECYYPLRIHNVLLPPVR